MLVLTITIAAAAHVRLTAAGTSPDAKDYKDVQIDGQNAKLPLMTVFSGRNPQ